MARLLILGAMASSLASCAATYQGARQDVGTGVEKLGGWIKPDEKK
jgi:predicted small secreted protein